MRINRKRRWLMVMGVFVMVFLAVLAGARSGDRDAEAASLADFDAGYIISDWQMGNYTSMSEADIQAFLTAKNSCGNRDYGYYLALSANTSYKWHWADGHFVCLSEERFGDGEVIGSGDTAAHIIWQAAQDYKINPQVLLVLLQKETSLITDPIPNDGDYRKATGYGCPDTAPCSSEYYGFKNQIRKAAALFRTVLDGGWTNYPLGDNYVQYNPNPDCGGSVVNIRSLATSALYRYTPYQPNAGALAAGYGTAECGAYGNRNFYLYFQDWFGGIRDDYLVSVEWQMMRMPRKMVVTVDTMQINPVSGVAYTDVSAKVGDKFYFVSKTDIVWNGKDEVCLRTEDDTNDNINRCILMSRMRDNVDPEYVVEQIEPIMLRVKNDTFKYKLEDGSRVQELRASDYGAISFSAKTVKDGIEYYQTSYDVSRKNMYFVPWSDLTYNVLFADFVKPRNMVVVSDADFIDLGTMGVCRKVENGYVDNYATKTFIDGVAYYRTKSDTEAGSNCAIEARFLREGDSIEWGKPFVFNDFVVPRDLKFLKNTRAIDMADGTSCDIVFRVGDVVRFTTKVYFGGVTYYRTAEESSRDGTCVFPSASLGEV